MFKSLVSCFMSGLNPNHYCRNYISSSTCDSLSTHQYSRMTQDRNFEQGSFVRQRGYDPLPHEWYVESLLNVEDLFFACGGELIGTHFMEQQGIGFGMFDRIRAKQG